MPLFSLMQCFLFSNSVISTLEDANLKDNVVVQVILRQIFWFIKGQRIFEV